MTQGKNFRLRRIISCPRPCATWVCGQWRMSKIRSLVRGLAPPESSTEARKKMFDQLELVCGDKKTGYVTARTFWEWTVVHVKGMIELQKAGKGWRENH